MANQITKIYELRTIGYDTVISQLQNIEGQFQSIAKLKKQLNEMKFDDADAARIQRVNQQLKEQKIQTQELRLQRQQLKNEAIALQNARQQEIIQQRQATQGSQAEASGIQAVIEKQKELKRLIQTTPADRPINFGGAQLNQQQAISQFQQMGAQIRQFNSQLQGTQQVGSTMSTALANGFNKIKGSIGAMILTYSGWFTAFHEAARLIGENKELSDSYADLQIRIKGTAEDVDALVDKLKQIDTRTPVAQLVSMANVISKKTGTAEGVVELTAAFDKMNVVLGKEIGDPEKAVANIVKLISIFNEDRHVTAQRVDEIGASLFKLTTSGVATGEFLVNFAERVGAVRGITGLTLPNVLGLGAALQQLGQRTEVAGTAAVQLTTLVFANVEKYAKAAGKSVQEFRKTLDDNPFEALVQVAEGLANMPAEEMAAEFEEVATAFNEVNVRGARIKAVLGDIGTNADFVRDRMKKAAVTTQDYANQSAAAELKQHTFAATLERIRKEFELIATSRGVQAILQAVAAVILLIVGNLNIIIPLLATYGVLWGAANAAMLRNIVVTNISNGVAAIRNGLMAIGNTFTRAYTAAIILMTGAEEAATARTILMNAAMRALPIGLLITGIALIVAGFVRMAAAANGTTEALRKKSLAEQAERDITTKANEATAEQITKMETLVKVIESTVTGLDTKKKALEELVGMNHRFSAALKDNAIDLGELRRALADVRDEIQKTARAQAAADLASDRYKEYLKTVRTQQLFETKLATAPKQQFAFDVQLPSITTNDVSSDERKGFLEAISGVSPNTHGDMMINGKVYKSEEVFTALAKKKVTALRNYQVFQDAATKAEIEVKEADRRRAEPKLSIYEQIKKMMGLNLTIDELKGLIDGIDEELKKLREGDPKIQELLKARKQFEARLKALQGKEARGGGADRASRLTGDQKDELMEIDAAMRLELMLEERRFAELQLNHKATFEEEIEHTDNMAKIQQRFTQQKINFLEGEKALNAREKLTLATFHKEMADLELKRLSDRQAILDREFQLERQNLKARLDRDVEGVQVDVAERSSDATLTHTDRAQLKLDGDRRILALQEKYNQDMDKLEQKLNQRTRENTREGQKTREQIVRDTVELFNAKLKDAEDAGTKNADEIQIRIADRVIKALQSGKSSTAIAREIEKLRAEETRGLLSSQVAELKIELDLYEQGLSKKLKSEKDYLEAKRKLKQAEAKLTEDTVNQELSAFERFTQALKDFGASFLQNVLGIKKYTDDAEGEAEKFGDAWKEAQATVKATIDLAYEHYWETQKQELEDRFDLLNQRLDIEEQEVKARAQSQAEIESIEKQFAVKRKALEKQEAEEKRQLALKQLTVDFALAVVKAFAQYGFPAALIPIAAMTIAYGVQRGIVNSQKFEEGGEVPTRTGGRITGRSHAQGGVKFNYEAEGQELAIINRRSAQSSRRVTVEGTPMEIASKINELGGGVAFRPGAKLVRFAEGGLLGSNYQAPVFNSSINNPSSGQEAIGHVVELIKATNDRIDRIEVIQVTDTVTQAQQKQVKQNQIGIIP